MKKTARRGLTGAALPELAKTARRGLPEPKEA